MLNTLYFITHKNNVWVFVYKSSIGHGLTENLNKLVILNNIYIRLYGKH